MLAYERRGSGPPLVLIHGIGSRWQVWSPVLDEVTRHRDVIALDLPGFGASPPCPTPSGEPKPGSVDHLADLVCDFLAVIGVERPEVAGSSLGGGIALELGRRGLAARVTAFSPVGFWGPLGRRWCQTVVGSAHGMSRALPGLLRTRAGKAALCAVFYAHPGRLSTADALDSARALAAAPGFGSARAAFGDWTPRLLTDPGALARIPVTIGWGTRDIVCPYKNQARRARGVLPTARHVPLPGCGHLPFLDDPRRCADLLTGRQ
jgi:pimeloyl-ACP methyl ester carboxylesterase